MRASYAFVAISALAGQATADFVQIAACKRFMDSTQPWHTDAGESNWMKSYGFGVSGSAILKADKGTHNSELLVSLSVTKGVEHSNDMSPVQGKFDVVGHSRHCFDNHGGEVYRAPERMGFGDFVEDPHFVLSVTTECMDGVTSEDDFFGNGYHRCNGESQPGIGNTTRHFIPGTNLRSLMIKYPEHLMQAEGADPLKEKTIACCDLYPAVADSEDCDGAEILADELKKTELAEESDLDSEVILRDIYHQCDADRKDLNNQISTLKSSKHCAQSGYLSLSNALTGIVVGGVCIIFTAIFMYCCCMKKQGVKMTFWRRQDNQL